MDSTELTSDIDLNSYAASMELAKAVGAMHEPDTKLLHYFAGGIYVRYLTIPKGTVIVGKKHRKACINIMLKGDITIFADGDSERFVDHYIGIVPAGIQKAARVHKETIWLNIYAVDSEDLEELEKELIISDENTTSMIKDIRNFRGIL